MEKITSEGFYSWDEMEKTQSRPNIEDEIWTVGFVFHRWMSGAKRSPKRLVMIVRVPKHQKLSRNGRTEPYTCLSLNVIMDYIVIMDVHQNHSFSPRIRGKI